MRISRTLAAWSAIVAMAALAAIVFCSNSAPAQATRGCRATPGVVLVCIDTLRADGPGASMPRLDAFARGSTVFADASAPSAWTAPSVSTLLSGLVPSGHGVRSECGQEGDLVPQVRTLAEMLRAEGWSTAALTGGGWVAPHHGLAQGFGAFGCTLDVDGPEAAIAMWRRKTDVESAPFFLFLHTYAAHSPYGAASKAGTLDPRAAAEVASFCAEVAPYLEDGAAPPPASILRRVVIDFLTDGGTRLAYVEHLGARRADLLWAHGWRWMEQDFATDPERGALGARIQAAYTAGLADADAVFARILDSLDRAGLPTGTAIVVVGDHGEAFGEHGSLSHGRALYDELVRVPLIVHAPGRFPEGTVVRGSCGLVDVLPTILDLAGAPLPAGLDGRSLSSLARGLESGHPVLAEEMRRLTRDGGTAIDRMTSVRTEAAKFISTVDEATGAARFELFDLAADPGERHPLDASEASRFGAAFASAVERVLHVAGAAAKPSPHVTAGVKPVAAHAGD